MEHKKLQHKIRLLRNRGSPDEEIAEVLEIDVERLKEMDGDDDQKAAQKAAKVHHGRRHPRLFEWNQSFDFLLEAAEGATVTFELKTEGVHDLAHHNRAAEDKKIKSHGKHKVKLSAFARDPMRKMVETVVLHRHEKLKFRLNLLFFDTPVSSSAEDWVKTMKASGHEDWVAGDVDGDLNSFIQGPGKEWNTASTHHFQGENADPEMHHPAPEVPIHIRDGDTSTRSTATNASGVKPGGKAKSKRGTRPAKDNEYANPKRDIKLGRPTM